MMDHSYIELPRICKRTAGRNAKTPSKRYDFFAHPLDRARDFA
jgi:hypothetical protein